MNTSLTLIPARRVIEEAMATNERLGHDNLGSVSYSHGFLPREEPLKALPASHAAWDEAATKLPEYYRNFAVRKRLSEMPLLHVDDSLPDRYMQRVASILGVLAHVYWYSEPDPPSSIPACIDIPWREVAVRLGRPAAHLSFIDLNTYNWHFIDPSCAEPFNMENLKMAVPMVGNEDERRFQMTPIELLYRFSPMMGAILIGQEAVVADDPARLKEQLIFITNGLHQLNYHTFMKVNPNPYSGKYYVNPVVWGKTAALFASPFKEDEYVPGPSGTYIPSFNTLDILFGRKLYKSTVGHEMARTRQWYPRFWREWLDALEEISIPDYVAQKGDRTLQGIYDEARDAYAGENGLLGRHRLKAYGYLDLSFKAGRVKTLGGIEGGYSERVWDRLALDLEEARSERYYAYPQNSHMVPVKRVETVCQHENGLVKRIVFDVSGTGIRYTAGDRCGILPENSAELIDKTLVALQAMGAEVVSLDRRWREHLALRHGYEGVTELPLRMLLRFGRIRPVDRPIALNLYGLTQNEQLRHILDGWVEDQWELWDLLGLLRERGYNTKRLWQAVVGDYEHICRIVLPERWRLYSLSSVMVDPKAESASELHLTIGGLAYETAVSDISRAAQRQGTSSNFLARLMDGSHTGLVSIKVVHPPRFSLPQDSSRPIVMFAGGTGLAPMRGLIEERGRTAVCGANWLFFGTRTRDEFYYQQEFEALVAQGKLEVRTAFSQEDITAVFDQETACYQFIPTQRRRIGEEMLQDDNAAALWQLLRSIEDGGDGAYFYLCGRTAFANTVLDVIKQILTRFAAGETEAERAANAQQTLFKLVGEDRFMLEIFTAYAGSHLDETKRRINISEVARRNNDENGYWMIVSGRVYDTTEFGHIHPGGMKIIQSYAGMDATYAYQAIEHHTNPEVDAMLGMYELGVVRPLNFGQVWGVAVTKDGLKTISLRDLYQAWVDLLYTLVEMENAVMNDFRVRHEPLTDAETADNVLLTPIKVVQLGRSHQQVVENYLPQLVGVPLETLWAATLGVVGEVGETAVWLKTAVQTVHQSNSANLAQNIGSLLNKKLQADSKRLTSSNDDYVEKRYGPLCNQLGKENLAVLQAIKLALCEGVALFEQYEAQTAQIAGKQLLTILRSLPERVTNYYERVAVLAKTGAE